MSAKIDPGETREARRILLEIMSRENLSLKLAEEKAVERCGNAIIFDQAKMALRQEEPKPPKAAEGVSRG